VTLTVSIDKLTEGFNLTEEDINNCFFVNVIVQVSFSVVFKLNNHLVSCRIEQNITDVGRFESVRLEEHDEWKCVYVKKLERIRLQFEHEQA